MMKQKDGRVNTMSEILYGIRVIKFYAWEINFAEKIDKLRLAYSSTYFHRIFVQYAYSYNHY